MHDLSHHLDKIKNKLSLFVPRKKHNTVLLQHPVLTKNLTTLENRLKGAIQFLKNTRISKNGVPLKLYQFPWYLVIGAKGAGKTTLLANANIHYILEKNFNHDIVLMPPSENCDWWITHDTVFVDLPGHYFAAKNKKNALSHNLWENFLILLHRYRGKKALNGIVIAISLEELIQPTKREALLRRLNARLNEIKSYLSISIPIYITITKCDLIPGFVEFFSDSSSEELNQAWGVSLPATDAALITIFTQRFNSLIKRLNEQLIWRLHQEHNPFAKVLIKDFPLQIERIKDALIETLKMFPQASDVFNTRGIFLTSSVQNAGSRHEADQEHPTTLPAHELSQGFEILRAPELESQSYFIRQFLLHGLIKPGYFSSLNKKLTLACGVLASISIISLSIVGNYFYHKHQVSDTPSHIDLLQKG